MKCTYCGYENRDGAHFCEQCGASLDEQMQRNNAIDHQPDQAGSAQSFTEYTIDRPNNPFAVAGFVVSLVCLVGCCLIFFGVIGLVLSIVGYIQCEQRGQAGQNFAIAGIVIGAIDLIGSLVLLLL